MLFRSAAMAERIPIAHIHGGEATEGLIDEAIRHSVTKMAHLHFVAAEEYRRRVIQLGEQPDRTFNVGAMALDCIERLPNLSVEDLQQEIGFEISSPLFLVTYHPVTLIEEGSKKAFEELAHALLAFEDATVVITKSNADAEGRAINLFIEIGRAHV